MEFADILEQTIALLQHQGRISYGALKRRFGLDDAYLDDLKIELIEAQQLARDENGRILVWAGLSEQAPLPVAEPMRGPAPSVPQGEIPHGERHTPNAERRQLTVLLCDLVDSTALAEQLDPEDLRDVIRAYQAACAMVIEPLAGHIAQYLWDGLLVYFGYPQAHEDDAQRAVRAGLGMVAAVQALNTQLAQRQRVRIAVRIGIHTGVVMVGEMGGGSRQEQLALGDTPNLAARLQGLAAPDTVVLSAATFRLVQGYFTYQDLGAHTLRGVSASVQVYRILGESGVQGRLEAVALSRLTPLVGREEEVALLHRRCEQATMGIGQVVLLSGEAGIGKSRLVQVLKDHVAHEPHVLIEWRGSSYHQQSALHPVIDHLHRLLRWHHYRLGITLYYQGEFSAARAHQEQVLASSLQRLATSGTQAPHVGEVYFFCHMAYTLWLCGYPAQALARSQQALTLGDEQSSPFALAAALYYAGMLRIHLRQEEFIAQEQADAAILLATEQGYAEQLRLATFLRGVAVAAHGRVAEGIAQMHQGLDLARAAGEKLALARWLSLLAAAYVMTGQAAVGLSILEEAWVLVNNNGIRTYEAELYRLKGEFLLGLTVENRAEATACFHHALDVARRQQAKSLELRAAMSLARLWQRQGRRAAAHELLAPVYGWFTEGFDTADLQEARGLLEVLA
jgi:class 3 adenylate cyclase